MNDNAAELLKHFFLEIRDISEEYEPATLTAYRKGLRRYLLKRREGENFDVSVGDGTNLNKNFEQSGKHLKASENYLLL